MSAPKYGVVSIGNALVDVLAKTDDAFIAEQKEKHGMEKGAMTLIEEVRAVQLYSEITPDLEMSGGSAANTMAGFASFGGKGAFIGKVADDLLGKTFGDNLKEQGLTYQTQPLAVGASTGRCIILVTPDANRTMNTFLGASSELSSVDVDEQLITDSKITYLEGYLFDRDLAKAAFIKAAEIAHVNGHRVALSLSDPFCVDRHRDDFKNLVENHIDILFANEDEIKSLYQVDTFEEAQAALSGHIEVAALTRGEKGAVIVGGAKTFEIQAEPVANVVDTTGAGDQFAAGFLYGFTEGLDLDACGRLGALAAAEIISHVGARPLVSLSDIAQEKKLVA